MKTKKLTKAQIAKAEKKILKKKWDELSKQLRTETPYCQLCHNFEGLSVHHLLEKRLHKDLYFERMNLIVLCRGCHFEIHDNSGKAFQIFCKVEDKYPDKVMFLKNYLKKVNK